MFNTQSVWQLPVRDAGRGKGSGKHMPHYLRNKLNRFALESNCAGSSSITRSSRSRSRSRSRREAACHTCHRCSLGADVRGVASGGRCPSIYIYSIVCVIYENHTLIQTHTHMHTPRHTRRDLCVLGTFGLQALGCFPGQRSIVWT